MENRLPIERWPIIKRKRAFGKIKNGYKVNPENPFELLPDLEQIPWFEQAFDYLEAGNSLRETTEWVSQKLKITIVHQTLSNLYREFRKPYIGNKKTKRRPAPKVSKEAIQLATEKRKATAALKKANALEKALRAKERQKKNQLKPEDYETPPRPASEYYKTYDKKLDPFKDAPASVNIIFKPNEGPQTEFLMAEEDQVLYGGAAGGGKSYAMLADPMRYFENEDFVGLLLRRTNDELRELKWESFKLYKKAFPDAKWNEQQSMWTFPSGAKFWMSYLDRDEDVLRYQGQAFTWIGVDELTQYPTPYAWNYLFTRLRTGKAGVKAALGMRATTNPGGPGHHWVKKMFIDPAPPGDTFWGTNIDTGEVLVDPDTGEPLITRRFIPSKLADNPYLAEDGIYRRNLLSLPDDLRRKLLDGDWTVAEGAAFSEWRPDKHVIEPFEIPDSWMKFRCADYGYTSHSAVLWIAVNPIDDQLVVYRELYVTRKTGVDLAHMILEAEAGDGVRYGVLDSAVWANTGTFGPSPAEEMIQAGCKWRKADKGPASRTAGKNRLHELLKVNPWTDRPGIVFFNTCRQTIADIPSLPQDPDGKDDIDPKARNDHTYDALRYGIMSRPRSGSALDWGNRPDRYNPADATFGY